MINESTKDNIKTEALSLVLDLNNIILTKWNYAIDQIAKREFYRSKDADVWDEQTCSSINHLYLSIRNSFCKDTCNKKTEIERVKEVRDILRSNNVDEIIDLFYEIDSWLYRKGVTKFDTKTIYDRQIVEKANRHKGY